MANLVGYKGGPLLTNVSPMALWATVKWADGTISEGLDSYNNGQHCLVDQFFVDILSSSWMAELSQAFSQPGYTIGAGAFLGTGSLFIEPQRNPNLLYDTDIQAALADGIANGLLPNPPSDACYFVMIPADAIVIFQGNRSDVKLRGYHNAFNGASGNPVYYCPIVGFDPSEDYVLTESISHELAEQVTDPGPPLSLAPGWIGPPCLDSGGLPCEVCDYNCAATSVIHGYSVSRFVLEDLGGGTIRCGPLPDYLPGTDRLDGVIRLTTSVRTSCVFGSILENQYVSFYADTQYRGQPTAINYADWEAYDQDGTWLPVATDPNQAVSWVFIPPGTKSVEVRVFVRTANLGCIATLYRTFAVVTRDEAIAEEKVCELIPKLVALAHIREIPPLVAPPIWDPMRDRTIDPLTLGELDQLVPFARSVGRFVHEAEPLLREFVREARTLVRVDNAEGRDSSSR
jgi:hypothetical protein